MNPKVYLVGGAVRDYLLGRDSKDRDYVVVGADVQYMLDRGFEQVGQSFPVFLHPETREEYALARRERKVAPGYTGFEFEFGPHVTLEDDLIRRDLTINSMAMDTETNEIIDPFSGRRDLGYRMLRHTSGAFAEDPLRVLRVARFAARYGFDVAHETENMMRDLVERGEVDALTNERIWTEIYKMLSESDPSKGFAVLGFVGALKTKSLSKLVRKGKITSLGVDKMNVDEKIYHFLDLAELSKDEINALKVPSDIWRRSKFFDQMISFDVDSLFNEFDVVSAIKAFDQYRQEFKNGDVMKVKAYYNKCGMTFFDAFFDRFNSAVMAVDALDFTDLVKGMNPKDIRDLVATTKQKVFLENFKCMT